MTGPSDAGANVLQKEEAHAVLQSLRQGVLLLRVPVYPAERSAAYFFSCVVAPADESLANR